MKAKHIFTAALATLTLAAFAEWPAIVTNKTLYAKNDLRGKKAPDFVVENWLTGKAPNLKGKVLLIDFWATWCGPCRALIPELNEFQAKFKNDLVVVGVSDEKPETVSEFMKKTEMKYDVAIDTQKRMSKVVGVQGIPHVLVISPDGIVRWQGFSGSKEDPLTEEKIAAIIAESKKLK
jgi:thiol-disulfide isomerase/thioredoxin